MKKNTSAQDAKSETLNMQSVLSMRSSGYYSQRTAGAKHAIDSVLPLMKEALGHLSSDMLRFAILGRQMVVRCCVMDRNHRPSAAKRRWRSD